MIEKESDADIASLCFALLRDNGQQRCCGFHLLLSSKMTDSDQRWLTASIVMVSAFQWSMICQSTKHRQLFFFLATVADFVVVMMWFYAGGDGGDTMQMHCPASQSGSETGHFMIIIIIHL